MWSSLVQKRCVYCGTTRLSGRYYSSSAYKGTAVLLVWCGSRDTSRAFSDSTNPSPSSKGTMAKRAAVILAGCGVYDGTEIHEASAILVHLSRAGAKVQMFAPNADMMHVVNHCEGKPVTDKRNVMEESARIARGEVTDLAKLNVADHDVLLIPGGFGAAKNLSDWATKGKEYSVKPLVEKVIKSFHQAGKPIAMCCISPVLAAKAIPGCELTVGHDCECEKWPYAGVAKSMVELGCKHVNKNVGEVHVDKKNKLVTTSAFMCNAPVHEIFDGLGVMVTEVLKMV